MLLDQVDSLLGVGDISVSEDEHLFGIRVVVRGVEDGLEGLRSSVPPMPPTKKKIF